MSTDNKNIVIFHATDFQSKATAAYLLWIYRKLIGVPRDNIMLYAIKNPEGYLLPFEEDIIADQRFYFVGCSMHPAFEKKEGYRKFFTAPAEVHSLFNSFPYNAAHTYPNILSKMFARDMPLYRLTDEALEAFRPYMDDIMDGSNSPWEQIRKNASPRIQHLKADEQDLSVQEITMRTASVIMEEIASYLSEHDGDAEIMKRIENYPWYARYLRILAEDTTEVMKHMLSVQLFPLMFVMSHSVWNSETEKQQKEKFQVQFYAGTTIYNTDVDHAQFWFTLFDECQIITEKVDADGKTIVTTDEPMTPVQMVLLKEKDTHGVLIDTNLLRPNKTISLFDLVDISTGNDRPIVLDEPVRLKSIYFSNNNTDSLLKFDLAEHNLYLFLKDASDSGDRNLAHSYKGWLTPTSVLNEETETAVPFECKVFSTVSMKTGNITTTINLEAIDSSTDDNWQVAAYELDVAVSNGIRNMMKAPDMTDPRLLVNQIFQAGCAILEHTEAKERYISRTCAFPLQLTIGDKVLTLMALNTPPARPEIMAAVMEDVFDGYVQFEQISKEIFVLNIDICVPAKSVFSEDVDSVEQMEIYLNNLAIENTLRVKISPTSDRTHDRFVGSLQVFRGTWNHVLNASDIDKKDITLPIA